MSRLLEVLLAFVGTMLVLALVAQSIQEVIKAMFALKGQARLQALQRLIVESSQAAGLGRGDGEQLFTEVEKRLRAIGQHGLRTGAVRLDIVTPDTLKELLKAVDPSRLPELRAATAPDAERRLAGVADQAERWFDLAMQPVEDRYRRRMRGWALGSSALIVLAFNADALVILDQARLDPAFRAEVESNVGVITDLRVGQRALADSLALSPGVALGPDGTVVNDSLRQVWQGRHDSLAARQVSVARELAWSEGFLGTWRDWRPRDGTWWIGILASILLVSLGAPFWHDLLEALFGLKNRVRAQAAQAQAITSAKGGTP